MLVEWDQSFLRVHFHVRAEVMKLKGIATWTVHMKNKDLWVNPKTSIAIICAEICSSSLEEEQVSEQLHMEMNPKTMSTTIMLSQPYCTEKS